MLPHSAHQTVCYSGVEDDPALVRHHVDIERLHLVCKVLRFLLCHPEHSEGPRISGQDFKITFDEFGPFILSWFG